MWISYRSNGEEGASATLFVIALTALLGVALLALDAGSLFVSRRGQIADTDAGALAAASKLIDQPCTDDDDAAAEAEAYVQTNDATTSTDVVTIERDQPLPCHPAGTVTVETSHPAQLYFAPLFGYDAIDTGVISKVRFGHAQELTGVRPIGICSQEAAYATYSAFYPDRVDSQAYHDAVAAGVATGEIDDRSEEYSGNEGYVFRINFSRTFPATSDCFGAPGNWGWLDFNGGPPSQPELEANIRSGYEGGVSLGGVARGDEDCNTEDGVSPDLDCDAGPGSRRATQRAMDDITCPDCEVIYVVVYDGGNGETGTNAEFNLKSLVGLRLWGSDVGRGTPGYIDVEFVSEQVSGVRLGAFDPDSTAPLGTTMCGTGGFDNCG